MIAKRIFLVALVSGILYSQVSSQDARIPKVVGPSPDAAALQKFGDMPISAYTGTPGISIPLYEIKSGDISVPVSISYNASGIKVADEASRVGLGWNLNAGGAISRNIIGDDDWEDYHSQTTFEIPLGPKYDQGRFFNYAFNCLHTINGYTLPEVPLNNETIDFKPDQYSYNFNGHSGKFVLRRNKDVVLNKVEKIEIKALDNNANVWEIKTPDGFVYRFEDIETYIDGSQQRKSSWYLSKITSPTGKTVQFTYTTLIQDIQPAGAYFESRPIGFLYSDAPAPPLPSYYSGVTPAKTYHSLYLSKITFDEGEVQFNYAAGRVDVVNDVQLNSIQVYSKKYGEPANTLLKSWNFVYSYFAGSGGVSNPTYPDLHYKRLKLTSLQEASPSSTLPPYVFYYEEGIPYPPGKLSFARDHWGYFNGKNTNISLIPTYVGGGGGMVNLGAMSSERNPDPAKNQMFILNKIQYPTGGFTTFEYETHDFDLTNSIVNDHSFYATYKASVPAIKEANFSNTLAGGTFTGTLDLTDMYPSTQEVIISAAWAKTSGFPQGSGFIQEITCSLKDASGLEIGGGQIASWLGATTPPMTEYLGTSQLNSGVRVTLKKILSPGIYTWSFYVPASYAVQGSNVYASYSKAEDSDPIFNSGHLVKNALFGGGLRIKRIKDYTDASAVPKVRRYNYHFQVNNEYYSYGRRMGKPNYTYYDILGGSATRVPCLMRESDSNIPLNGSTNGVTVAYDKVEELYGENGENGKTIYEYTNQPDVILDYRGSYLSQDIPLKSPYGGTIGNAGNGDLLKKTVYANYNGGFVMQREDIFTYQDLTSLFTSAVYGIDKRVVSDQNAPGQECGRLSFFVYPAMTMNRPVLISSVSKSYDITGTSAPIIATTEYTYNNSTHLQLTAKSEYRSNGDKITTSFKYPADYEDVQSDAAILLMKGAAYMHAFPIDLQKRITKGTNVFLTAAEINKYQVLNNKIFQKEKAVLEPAQPININIPPSAYNPASGSYPSGYATGLVFDGYDASGNILQVHKPNDAPVAYVWDYFSSNPVAEVINATVTDIAYTSFEADGKGGWVFPGAGTADPSAPTGKKSYDLGAGNILKSGLNPVSTYIISYWSTNGAKNVNGSQAVPVRSIGGWTCYEHKVVSPAGGNITISGSGAIDEVRLFPEKALMTTYTYESLVGISGQCDSKNAIKYYAYDEFGRLSLIRDQDGKILKKICYNYSGQPENCGAVPIYSNSIQSGNFTRENCGTGYIGSTVTYTVAAGTYTSYISPADANQQAINDVNTNGQAYANMNGVCTPDIVTVTSNNYVNTPGYTATYTNNSTSQQYTFTISRFSGVRTMGTVPAGTYTVNIAKPGGSIAYLLGTYNNSCSVTNSQGASATFNNVVISNGSACNGVIIDFP